MTEQKAREITRYVIVTISRGGECWDEMRESDSGNYVLFTDHEEAIEAANAKIAELEAQARAELMEGQEPSDRAQEAAHYNWLDDQNEKLTSKLDQSMQIIDEMRHYIKFYGGWKADVQVLAKIDERLKQIKGGVRC